MLYRTTDRILEKKRHGFEAELVRLNANLTRRGCTKRYAAVLCSIGRYQEHYK